VTPSVLILSDEPEFGRALLGRWQRERTVPAITVMGPGAWQPVAQCQSPNLAIATGPLENCRKALANLEQEHVPAIYLCDEAKDLSAARQKLPRTVVLKKSEDWLETIVLFATEMLRRVAIAEVAAEAELRAREAERFSLLGKYMLEMRHTLNNALTSVVGNAELLLMEPGTLAGEAREQVDTIHSMSLRIHEVIQRFSSLETEMKFAERDSQSDTAWKSAVSGA